MTTRDPDVDGPAAAEDDEGDGTGLGRLLAFSDGVFAIAFTILVLDLEVPDDLSPAALRAALVGQLPHVYSALLSFAVIGRFWVAHHGMLARVRAADGPLLTLNTVLLATVALVPFAASLLAEYGRDRLAVVIYSATVGATAALQLVLWWWVARRGLHTRSTTPEHVARYAAGIGGAVVAFVVAIPVAFVSTVAAELCWLLAFVPVGWATRFSGGARRGS